MYFTLKWPIEESIAGIGRPAGSKVLRKQNCTLLSIFCVSCVGREALPQKREGGLTSDIIGPRADWCSDPLPLLPQLTPSYHSALSFRSNFLLLSMPSVSCWEHEHAHVGVAK